MHRVILCIVGAILTGMTLTACNMDVSSSNDVPSADLSMDESKVSTELEGQLKFFVDKRTGTVSVKAVERSTGEIVIPESY